MYCPKCGYVVDSDWNICPDCGFELHKIAQKNVSKVEKTNIELPTRNITHAQKSVQKRTSLLIVGILITVLLIIFIMISIFFLLRDKNAPSQIGTSINNDIEGKQKNTDTFTELDFEELIGKPEEALREFGLEYDNGAWGYRTMDDKVQVYCTDGIVDGIIITGNGTPSFHGVSIGMSEAEACKLLSDKYSEYRFMSNADGKTFVNLDVKGMVSYRFADSKISMIMYGMMTDIDIAGYQEEMKAEYIFPDSDKRYLSEDEIRCVGRTGLAIGRNEIFARHGYIFQDETFSEYFMKTSWYTGTISAKDFNSEEILNDFEKENIELIKKVENETNDVEGQKSEKQEVLDNAYDFVAGKKFHMIDSQMSVEFTASGEFIAIGYYGSAPLINKYSTYSFSAEYELYKDWWHYLTYVNIEGNEYFFRYFNNGQISLDGTGEFAGWYELVQ